MSYQVKVAGKIFEGSDARALLRLAVAARRAQIREKLRNTLPFQAETAGASLLTPAEQ